MQGILYVVATPIGNMEDMTERAKRILASVSVIAAEDTRNSSVLLNKFGIKTKLVSNYLHNEEARVDYFISLLQNGSDVALISDAGTPCISDPGYLLVNAAVREGIKVEGVCGACAAATAVSVCGFEAKSFVFLGFLPRSESKLKAALEPYTNIDSSVIVIYESPRRIKDTVKIINKYYPENELCLCNDLTKLYERIYRGKPREVLKELLENENSEKGEYTCVIKCQNLNQYEVEEISLEALIFDTIIKQNCTVKEAVKALSQQGKNKNALYDASLNLKKHFKKT